MTKHTKAWINVSDEIASLKSKLEKATETLRYTVKMLENLPSGIDEEADENATRFDDAVAHMGGLIWKRIKETIRELEKI